MEFFVILVNSKKLLTNITGRSVMKLVTVKVLKMNKSYNLKIISSTKKLVN